jgi:PAS domain S-box-containing protein
MPIRILLVDDSPGFLQSAASFLSADPLFEIVGLALSGRDALEQVAQLHPDLVLMDLAMPEMNGLEATRHIKAQPGGPRVVILTLHDNPEYQAAAQAVGADGFVAKSEFGAQLLPLIHGLFAGPSPQALGGEGPQPLLGESPEDVTLEALQESEVRYRSLFDGVPVGLYRITAQGRILDANPALVEMLGYPDRESLLAVNAADFYLDPEDRYRRQALLKQAGIVRDFEMQWCRRDGAIIWVRDTARAVRDADGQVQCHEGSLEDITERKQAEEQVHRRNRELALLYRVIAASATSQEMQPILEAVCLELALAFDVPQSAAALLNKEKTEAVVVAEYVAEGRPPALGETIPAARNPSSQYLLEHKAPLVVDDAQTDPRLEPIHDLMRQRGTVSLLLLPLLVEGEVVGSLGVDATEPRPFSAEEVNLACRVAEEVSGALARARLQETQRRLSTAVEQAAGAVIITDTDGTIRYVNRAFEKTTGYSRTEAVGQNAHILKSGKHNAAFYRELWQTLSAGQVWQGRFVNKRKEGSLFTEDATITPVRNQAGQVVNYVATLRDVTREVELEKQFLQAQKMEAVGRLAGGVAHDFNNLLTVIRLSTRMLERKLRPEDPLWQHVQRIQDAGRQAANLTKQLLAFSRREIIEPQVLDLNQVMNDLEEMLRRLITEDIELTTRLADDLWPVKADPTQIEQVVVNLAVNARDAMPGGGKLTIETGNAVLDAAYAAHHLEVEPGEYVMLAVSDTGTGMSDKVKAHLFEPFFSTKEKGKGTGLGLATVFGIVKQNKGHIGVYSEVGQGTTFKIYLPHVSEGVRTPSDLPTTGATPPARVSETLLLVEDKTGVRELVRDILAAQGYRVLTAQDGVEALQVAQRHEGPIHLLLTNVVMPRLGGRALADHLKPHRPEMRVLYTSGYTDDPIVHHGVLAEGIHFLSKPFEMETLARKVRDVLDATT